MQIQEVSLKPKSSLEEDLIYYWEDSKGECLKWSSKNCVREGCEDLNGDESKWTLTIFSADEEGLSSEKIYPLTVAKDFSNLREGEAVKFSGDEVKISFNVVFVSLEEVGMIYFRKEEVLRFFSNVISSGQSNTKG